MENGRLDTRWSELLFQVRRAVRYHHCRTEFFEAIGDWTNFLTIIAGCCVVFFVSASTTTRSVAAVWFGGAISALTAIDLVVGYAKKARQHADLARQLVALEREMLAIGERPVEADLNAKLVRRLQIEAEGPFILRVLEATCHNEVARSMGWPATELVDIGFWQDAFKQFFDFQPEKISDPR